MRACRATATPEAAPPECGVRTDYFFLTRNLQLRTRNWRGRSRDRGDEAISPPVHGFDIVRRPRFVSQHLPQITNTPCQRVIPDHSARPDRAHQLVFGDELLWMLHQIAQHGERFGTERNLVRLIPQSLIARVKAKRGEMQERRVHTSLFSRVTAKFQRNCGKITGKFHDFRTHCDILSRLTSTQRR